MDNAWLVFADGPLWALDALKLNLMVERLKQEESEPAGGYRKLTGGGSGELDNGVMGNRPSGSHRVRHLRAYNHYLNGEPHGG